MRAEMTRGIDETAAASGKDHAGRRRTWSLQLRIDAQIAELAFWFVDIASKCLGSRLRLGGLGTAAADLSTRQKRRISRVKRMTSAPTNG